MRFTPEGFWRGWRDGVGCGHLASSAEFIIKSDLLMQCCGLVVSGSEPRAHLRKPSNRHINSAERGKAADNRLMLSKRGRLQASLVIECSRMVFRVFMERRMVGAVVISASAP